MFYMRLCLKSSGGRGIHIRGKRWKSKQSRDEFIFENIKAERNCPL